MQGAGDLQGEAKKRGVTPRCAMLFAPTSTGVALSAVGEWKICTTSQKPRSKYLRFKFNRRGKAALSLSLCSIEHDRKSMLFNLRTIDTEDTEYSASIIGSYDQSLNEKPKEFYTDIFLNALRTFLNQEFSGKDTIAKVFVHTADSEMRNRIKNFIIEELKREGFTGFASGKLKEEDFLVLTKPHSSSIYLKVIEELKRGAAESKSIQSAPKRSAQVPMSGVLSKKPRRGGDVEEPSSSKAAMVSNAERQLLEDDSISGSPLTAAVVYNTSLTPEIRPLTVLELLK